MSLYPHLDDLLELRHQAHTIGLASHHPVNSVLCGLYASVFRGQGMGKGGDDLVEACFKAFQAKHLLRTCLSCLQLFYLGQHQVLNV